MRANRKRHFRLDDHKVVIIHDFLYSRQRYPFLLVSLVLYAMIILIWGEYFKVSANYFIILPLIVVAVAFGLNGGIIAGSLALPANLLLFYLIGHMEYAPANLAMAEISGVVVGSIMGYLSDFFTRMKEEMRRRDESEKALEKSLKEKDILLKEINHRVKNNLNLIKSIIQLQTNRVPRGEVKENLTMLRNRIISIAMVQDLLYSQDSLEILDLRIYLKELTDSLLEGFHDWNMDLQLNTGDLPVMMDSREMTSMGIIINEVITNVSKYAMPSEGKSRLTINLWKEGEIAHLSFRDNGPGYPEEGDRGGLGFKLIRSLLTGLRGHMELRNDSGGELILHIPESF